MPAPAPARLDEQLGDRGHVRRQRILAGGQRGLVGRAARGEAGEVRGLGLLDGDQYPVGRGRRLLDRGAPPLRDPLRRQIVQDMPGQQSPVCGAPRGKLDPGDLAGLVRPCRPDIPEGHDVRNYVKGYRAPPRGPMVKPIWEMLSGWANVTFSTWPTPSLPALGATAQNVFFLPSIASAAG